MLEKDDRDLLARLDERTKSICSKMDDLMDHADNGGWSRCAMRGEQIKALQKDVKTHADNHKWFYRLVVGSIVGQVIVVASLLAFNL